MTKIFLWFSSRLCKTGDSYPFQDTRLASKQRRWLGELDAWDERRESMLSERYDEQWERHKTRALIAEAIEFHIEGLLLRGETVPEPSSLAEMPEVAELRLTGFA